MQEIVHPKGKVYYSVGEVAGIFGVRPSLLRFWEEEFDTIKPRRNKKGDRLYRPEDVDNIRIIYHLVKERNMKLDVARKYIKDNKGEAGREAAIMEKLLSIRAMLAEIKAGLSGGDETDGEASGTTDESIVAGTAAIAVGGAEETKEAGSKKKPVKKQAVKPQEEKRPFEEQPLFEIPQEEEYVSVDDAMDAFIAKHYDEEADDDKPAVDPFAAIPGAAKREYDPGSEEIRRPVVIEQTLF